MVADSSEYFGDGTTWQVPATGKNKAGGQFAWHEKLSTALNGGTGAGSAAIIADPAGTVEGYIHLKDDQRVLILGNGTITFKDNGDFKQAELDIVGGTQNAGTGKVTIDVVNPKRYTIPL